MTCKVRGNEIGLKTRGDEVVLFWWWCCSQQKHVFIICSLTQNLCTDVVDFIMGIWLFNVCKYNYKYTFIHPLLLPTKKKKTNFPTSWSSDLFAVYGLSFEAFASNLTLKMPRIRPPQRARNLPCFQQGTSQCVFKSIRFCSFSRSAFSPQFRKGFMESIQRQSSVFVPVFFERMIGTDDALKKDTTHRWEHTYIFNFDIWRKRLNLIMTLSRFGEKNSIRTSHVSGWTNHWHH